VAELLAASIGGDERIQARAESDKPNEAGEARSRLLDESGIQGPQSKVIPNRYIITMKDRPGVAAGAPADQGQIENLVSNLRFDPRSRSDTIVFRHAISGFAATLSPAEKRLIESDPNVLAVEQDRVVSRQPVKRSLMAAGPRKELQTGVERVEGHLSPTANAPGGVDATIAIIDTGINLRHPDLNVVRQKSFVPGVATAEDDDGHGSHVAAIAAARKDGHGTVGVAPGARLWALKALDKDGNGSWSQIIAAIDYVTQHADKVDVVNMSLSDTEQSKALDRAISRSVDAGVTYVVAAGNDARDAKLEAPSNHPRVLTVSAISDGNGKGGGGANPACEPDEVDDAFATFSNYGKNVRLAAPGVCIEAASKRQGNDVDTYESMSGTSMAAPHAAGGAALIKAKNRSASPDQVIDKLISEAKQQSDPLYGFTGDTDGYSEPLLNVKNL
jgi:subtilisin family serine protease